MYKTQKSVLYGKALSGLQGGLKGKAEINRRTHGAGGK